jgi:hypothetical protein
MRDETLVLAVDPGLITGVCIVGFEAGARCVKYHSQELEFHEVLQWARTEIPTADVVVVEKFTINQRTIKNTPAPWSLEVTGIIRAVALEAGTEPVMQLPGDAMNLVDNDMLRRLDLWHRGGAGHANDSLRHAVLYAVKKMRWRDPRMVSLSE